MVNIMRDPSNVMFEELNNIAKIASSYTLILADGDNFTGRLINESGECCATVEMTGLDDKNYVAIRINSLVYDYENSKPFDEPKSIRLLYTKPEQVMAYAELLEKNGYDVTIIY
jgi:hypothetical protein